jgi:hypothetical protein
MAMIVLMNRLLNRLFCLSHPQTNTSVSHLQMLKLFLTSARNRLQRPENDREEVGFPHLPSSGPNSDSVIPTKSMIHEDGPKCDGCRVKLMQAHPDLSSWYLQKVKPNFPTIHISWSYRDKQAQQMAVEQGKSELNYPHSGHNQIDLEGNPSSIALDLFVSLLGIADWEKTKDYCTQIAHMNPNILWGGIWKSLGDTDHFQLKNPRVI